MRRSPEPISHDGTGAVRLLVLLNPGQTSRHYMLGIAAAAQRLGVLAHSLELGPIWEQLRQNPGADTMRRIASLCRSKHVTHVIGYAHNGVFDFGPHPDPLADDPTTAAPVGLFAALGLRHILLWTDHPNWAMQGSALGPSAAPTLAHQSHLHVVKSQAAAEELRTVLGWVNVCAADMGEDYDLLTPARDITPMHDVVLIMSDTAPIPHVLEPMLDEDDPDPAAMMRLLVPGVMTALDEALCAHNADDAVASACRTLARALIDARIAHPHTCWHTLAEGMAHAHVAAISWLRSEPRRWYALTSALNELTRWRRFFWPAWLGRRVDVGIYGSPAEPLGLFSPLGLIPGSHWAPYERQPEVYARGRVALNINAAHDEEGLTHKPFQIAASGACCIHHVSRGLERCFTAGEHLMTFERGPELLDHVRTLAGDIDRAQEMAQAMYDHARAHHTWDRLLAGLLGVSVCHSSDEPTRDAPSVESAA